jgi:hypothetical protein
MKIKLACLSLLFIIMITGCSHTSIKDYCKCVYHTDRVMLEESSIEFGTTDFYCLTNYMSSNNYEEPKVFVKFDDYKKWVENKNCGCCAQITINNS